MKKLIISILAIIYLGTAVGATVHLHYCMGKLVDWSLLHTISKCSNCGMKKSHSLMKNGCCKDETLHIQNVKDQKVTETAFQLIHATSLSPLHSTIELPSIKICSVTERHPTSHAPPIEHVAIYIRNRVFLI